jgi:hypothetical protein
MRFSLDETLLCSYHVGGIFKGVLCSNIYVDSFHNSQLGAFGHVAWPCEEKSLACCCWYNSDEKVTIFVER